MVDWTREQPILVYVRELTWKHFPEVAVAWADHKNYPTIHPTLGVGGFGHTTTAHGTPSRHTEGRACDIYFYTSDAQLYQWGLALFDQLATNASRLDVEDLIYYKRIWSARHRYVHATDARDMRNHRDHLHVGFSRPGSQRRPIILDTLFQEARKIGLGPLHAPAFPRPEGIRGGID
jgi:hypothetical protein